MSYHCTCPLDRNEPTCPEHAHAWVWRSRELPIWSQLAWEMDLNWSSDQGAHLLFWQHYRLPDWPFFFPTYTVAGTSTLFGAQEIRPGYLFPDRDDILAGGPW